MGAKDFLGSMKVLSIGNSFSQDAQRYLHRLAKREGVELQTTNLYIGGCSLETHYKNLIEDNVAYELEINGEPTGRLISLLQAIKMDDWDYITLQQASHFSGQYETYTPYIEYLAEYIRKRLPKAKIYIHQTWAYEDGSERLYGVAGYNTAEEMFENVSKAYEKAAKTIKADGVIPSGKAMMQALKMGIGKIHRDTFHASFGAGRYLLSLTWYKVLTGNSIENNAFDGLDEPISDKERKIVIDAVNSVF